MVTIQQHVAPWHCILVFAVIALLAGPGTARASDVPPDVVAEACLHPGETEAVIADVEDWRTLVLQDGRRVMPVGIADFDVIDTASSGLAGLAGDALTAEIRGLAGKRIRLRLLGSEPDRRRRLPALLWVEGRLIQKSLIAKGIAIAYPHDGELPCPRLLLAAEASARAGRIGYWRRKEGLIAGTKPQDFIDRINGFVIMQGRVLSVGTRTDRTYLNFGGRWATDVTVEIPDSRRAAFGGAEALETLAGARIRVRGFAVEKAGPMIELRHPWQIERLTKHPG